MRLAPLLVEEVVLADRRTLAAAVTLTNAQTPEPHCARRAHDTRPSPRKRRRAHPTGTAGDRDAIYDVCLRTGDAGGDASGLYVDRDLFGDIWAGPYLALRPHLAFVAEGDAGVDGYVVGAEDTTAFESSVKRGGGRRCAPATPIRPTIAS